MHRGVRVADAPELLGISKVFRSEIIEPVALEHRVLCYERELAGGGTKRLRR